jgi:F-type H+-transporting ATPase subunit gamma
LRRNINSYSVDEGNVSMPNIESIKRSLKTAEDLHSVVKSMKALAALNIRQYEKAVESLAEYNRTVEMGLQILLRTRSKIGGPSRPQAINRLAAVVFGSDQGMCGQLNDQIVAHAVETMKNMGVKENDCSLIAVGARIVGRLEDTMNAVQEVLPVPSSTTGITPAVQKLVVIIEEWHFKKNIDRVLLFFSKHLSGASFRPHTLHLLPVDEKWLEEIKERTWPMHSLPTFTMEWDRLFALVVRQYLFVSLYRAFAESMASENASRLASMQGAEKNIEERLEELSAQFHRQRQMSITEELLDIISGFTALEGEQLH